jgi:predicted nucleotidyltransferase
LSKEEFMLVDPMNEALALARRVAEALGAVDGVAAVVLGGSWARGAGDANSDIDLGIYYNPTRKPSLDALRDLAAALDDAHDGSAVTDYGEWGAWINGGAWLTIEGRRVDWLYRDLARVGTIIRQCRDGQTACHYQPGHPHGFHEHIYLGEVALCKPLVDGRGLVAGLKAQATPYPPLLKQAIIQKYLWEAGFALDTSRKSARRDEIFYVAGGLFRCAACLVQVVFALNEQYWINEKGSVRAAASFPLCPQGFEAAINQALGGAGYETAGLLDSIARLDALVEAARALCEGV